MIRIDENRKLFYTEFGEEKDLGFIKDGTVKDGCFSLNNCVFAFESFPEIEEIWILEWPGGKPEPVEPDPEFPPLDPGETEEQKKIKSLEKQLEEQRKQASAMFQSMTDTIDVLFELICPLIPPTE